MYSIPHKVNLQLLWCPCGEFPTVERGGSCISARGGVLETEPATNLSGDMRYSALRFRHRMVLLSCCSPSGGIVGGTFTQPSQGETVAPARYGLWQSKFLILLKSQTAGEKMLQLASSVGLCWNGHPPLTIRCPPPRRFLL